MKIMLTTYFFSLLSLFAIDFIWLGFVAKKFYSFHLGFLMSSSFKLPPAVIFYFIYALGISFFVVTPSLQENAGFLKVFLVGAFLGLIAYGAYDLTNHAIIKDWPTIVTIVDIAWGAFLTGSVSVISFYFSRLFL
jgi:uncharacterized membrane protein